MSSPITSWKDAGTIYTYADEPMALGIILILAVAATVFTVWATVRHEKHSYAARDTKAGRRGTAGRRG